MSSKIHKNIINIPDPSSACQKVTKSNITFFTHNVAGPLDPNAFGGYVGNMNDGPKTIAQSLINEHGLEGAIKCLGEWKAEALRQGDNYQLSVWREVGRILTAQKEAG